MKNNHNAKTPLFENIDSFVFKKIDELQNSSTYLQLSSSYMALDEDVQKIIGKVATVLLFLIPLFIVFIVYLGNGKYKSNLKLKVSMAEKAQIILSQKKEIEELKTKVLARTPLKSESELGANIRKVLSKARIDSKKIEIKKFEREDLEGNIIKSIADLNFENLTLKELSNLIFNLKNELKAKIISLSIKKNKPEETLSGRFSINHFGQEISSDSKQ